MELTELISKVRQIEVKSKRMSNEIFSGNYASTFKGRGMSFSEVRKYIYGDDVRNIDWNVTSKIGEPYVKEFEEERELTFMLLVDCSESMRFGSGDISKQDFMTEIAATLAFSSLKNNDKVGVVFFSDRIEKYIPPKKGRSHILRIIRELLETQSQSSGTDIGVALRFLHNTLKKRSIAFLLSDFLESKDYDKDLLLVKPRHQIFAIRIESNLERNLSSLGLIRIFNPENQSYQWIDPAAQAHIIDQTLSQHADQTSVKFNRLGLKICHLDTHTSYVARLAQMFR